MLRRIAGALAGWNDFGRYRKFEKAVGTVLSLCVSATILFALFHLLLGIVDTLSSDPEVFDYRIFQRIFEKILVVLIALEFNHSLALVATGQDSVIQVRTVLLIGLLAVVRKLLVIEIEHASPVLLASLSAAIVALGGVYWLVQPAEETSAGRRRPVVLRLARRNEEQAADRREG